MIIHFLRDFAQQDTTLQVLEQVEDQDNNLHFHLFEKIINLGARVPGVMIF